MRPQNEFQTIVPSPTHPRISPTTASTIACKATERNRGPSIKDVGFFLAIFDPDLLNFYLLISCNIGIPDPPPPKIFRRLLWMAPMDLGCVLSKGKRECDPSLKFSFSTKRRTKRVFSLVSLYLQQKFRKGFGNCRIKYY